MLSELHIRNFALIERLDLELGPGLNILTGETGAGKSILIDAINAILGERTGVEVIRSGAEKASVEGVFTLDDAPAVAARLGEEGLSEEDGTLILARELARTSQGAARINARRATVGALKAIGEGLVDLHGQHDHQTLLVADRHVEILDAWGGPEIASARDAVSALYKTWRERENELASLKMDERERARLADLYGFQIAEITDASPQPGEDEALAAARARLAGAEKLAEIVGEAASALTREAGAAVETLGSAVAGLREAERIDPGIAHLREAVESAYFTVQEAGRDVADYVDAIEFDPARLAEVEDRLDLLRKLKRKYGDSLEEVIAYRARVAGELETVEGAESRFAELATEIAAVRAALDAANAKLCALRGKAGESLREAMERELGDLEMKKTKFLVSLEPGDPAPGGADRVEFLISPNPGEPLKPLARIASGGELSRLMLALKSVVARADPVPVLIFDEIDTGVSGRQAAVIARKLLALAQGSQVLCVTHLPQIAAAADRHYLISKNEMEGRTRTTLETLNDDQRVEEIARMLAGVAPTDSARANARELIREFGRA